MPLDVYEQVGDEIRNALRQYYSAVATPIEAPGKEDFGDVDTLVTGPNTAQFDLMSAASSQVGQRLATALKAKAWVQEKGNPTINLAIPWPSRTNYGNGDEVLDEKEKYVQVDVHICRSKKEFEWELFHHAHGDIWNILGTTIRKFGLTANDRGLFLRIPEIELYDKKKSMVFLTDEPVKVLRFIGLDEARWSQRFKSADELYKFAAECKMFWVKDSMEDEESGPALSSYDGTVIVGQEGGESGKKKLKHNDRQRMAKRPLFRQWVEEFIPKCREQKLYSHTDITRDNLREDAFKEFGVQEEYARKLREWNLLKHNEEIWRDIIKERVPHDDPVLRGASIKMLKAILVECEEVDGALLKVPTRNNEGFYDTEEVKQFVDEHWETAGRIRLGRTQTKVEEAMRLKKRPRGQMICEIGNLRLSTPSWLYICYFNSRIDLANFY
ncbi:hypothetical protein B7463_g4193, partial [Scytalidium lignicola]